MDFEDVPLKLAPHEFIAIVLEALGSEKSALLIVFSLKSDSYDLFQFLQTLSSHE